MRAIKFFGLTVGVLLAGIVVTIFAAFYAICEIPFRAIGCDEIANSLHYLSVEMIYCGHDAIDYADKIMGQGPGVVTDNAMVKHLYSVSFFDPAWNNLESTTVLAHCEKCAKYEVHLKPEEYDYIIIETV